jgi:hypothetical protein
MNSKKGESVTNLVDNAKDLYDNDPVASIVGETVSRSSDAEFNSFGGYKKNITSYSDEDLSKIYKRVLWFCLSIGILMVVLMIAGTAPQIFAGIPLALYGLYALIFGQMVLKPGIARYSLMLGWKARIFGFIFLLLGIFVLSTII